IEREVDQGSHFHFTGHRPAEADDVEALYDEGEPRLHNYRSPRAFNVLLAEDLPTNADLAMLRLKQQGHQVTWVEDGKQAVVTVTQQDFDLVLMDVQMPEMDGLEA
ncbi:response regulator, partial [Oceanospirillum sediminis]